MHGISIFPLTFQNYTNEKIYQQETDLKELFYQAAKSSSTHVHCEDHCQNEHNCFSEAFLLFGAYLIKRKQTFPWRQMVEQGKPVKSQTLHRKKDQIQKGPYLWRACCLSFSLRLVQSGKKMLFSVRCAERTRFSKYPNPNQEGWLPISLRLGNNTSTCPSLDSLQQILRKLRLVTLLLQTELGKKC